MTTMETVLVVEDQRVVRELVREILENDGYIVLEAENPEQPFRGRELTDKVHSLLELG
jgi:CheY-like chemotaxis protein